MLSKRVCKKCHEIHGIGWCRIDKIRWKRDKEVYCPPVRDNDVFLGFWRCIDEKPEYYCLYELEHIVNAK
jgi:hypothetical protein